MVVLLMVTLTAGVAATASAQRLSCALGVNVVVRGGGQEIFGHPVVRPACLKPDLDVYEYEISRTVGAQRTCCFNVRSVNGKVVPESWNEQKCVTVPVAEKCVVECLGPRCDTVPDGPSLC